MHSAELKYFDAADQLIRARAAIKRVAINFWCVVLLFVGHGAASAMPATVTGTVTRVIDGDTIWVQQTDSSRPIKVRLRAIDAPEICQAGGVASRDALKAHALGKKVTLTPRATDDYKRMVASVDLQGQDIGRWLVRGGYAWSTGPFQSGGPYAAEQREAETGRRGLFGGSKAEHPKDFRQRNGSCYARR